MSRIRDTAGPETWHSGRVSATTVPAPDATLGRADPTRRRRLRFSDGREGFPGVTAVEADRVGDVLDALESADRGAHLVAVGLDVVVSDGAGPYLVDAEGRLMLVVGAHPAVPETSVALGPGAPGRHRVGAVRAASPGLWRWVACADVPDGRRVEALDGLAAAADPAALGGWEAAWGGGVGRHGTG